MHYGESITIEPFEGDYEPVRVRMQRNFEVPITTIEKNFAWDTPLLFLHNYLKEYNIAINTSCSALFNRYDT